MTAALWVAENATYAMCILCLHSSNISHHTIFGYTKFRYLPLISSSHIISIGTYMYHFPPTTYHVSTVEEKLKSWWRAVCLLKYFYHLHEIFIYIAAWFTTWLALKPAANFEAGHWSRLTRFNVLRCVQPAWKQVSSCESGHNMYIL